MNTVTQLMTADELLRLPRGRSRHELVKGELNTMPLAGEEHGIVTMNVALPLARHVRENDLGKVYGADTGFQIERNPDTVLGPDVAFVRKERIMESGVSRGYRLGAPDLVVEVISPGDAGKRVERKVQQWIAAGALTVWTVDPKTRTVKVYEATGGVIVLTEADELTGGPALPDFRLPVAEVFIK